MAALYTCELAGYGTFDVMTPIVPRTTDVMRFNANPVRCVARIFTFPLEGLVRTGTPAASVTALGSLLSSAVNTGTLPTSLKFKDASGTVLPGIGDVREGTADLWEDLELVEFELPPGVEQLTTEVRFRVTFRARRSFPDGDGVCEFAAERVKDADDLGRATRYKKCTIRVGKAAAAAAGDPGLVESSSAIRALLEEPKPVAGWIRTIGTNELPFKVTYPLWPLTHVAETESEVTRNVGGAGSPPDATKAEVGERILDDPSRGVQRITTTAETTAPNPGPWIGAQEPAGDLVSSDVTVGMNEGKGEWERLALLNGSSSSVARVHRRYSLRGSGRRAGVTEMSGGIAARTKVGPFVATRLREEIDVYGKGPAELAALAAPAPLSGGWLLDGATPTDTIGISEDAVAASQRMWVRSIGREYLWIGTDDPLQSEELNAALRAAMTESL